MMPSLNAVCSPREDDPDPCTCCAASAARSGETPVLEPRAAVEFAVRSAAWLEGKLRCSGEALSCDMSIVMPRSMSEKSLENR